MKTTRSTLLEAASIAALAAALSVLGGCDNDGPLENAAEEVDDAVDDAADDVEDAVDDAGDAIDDAADDATDPATNTPPPTGGS